VIKIRYSDLPGGLHVRAEVQGRHKVLYLLPGLTAAQRTAAIRRARHAARVGHGPLLPALGLARAKAADRIRTTVGNGLAAMRVHPALCVPPLVVIVAGTAAYLVLVSASGRILPRPAAAAHEASRLGAPDAVQRTRTGGRRVSGPVPGVSGVTGPPALAVRPVHRGARAGSPGGPASHVPSTTPSPRPSWTPHALPIPLPSSSQPASHVPSPSPSPSPSLSAIAGGGPSPVPSPSPSPSPSTTAGGGPSRQPSPPPSLSAIAGGGPSRRHPPPA